MDVTLTIGVAGGKISRYK